MTTKTREASVRTEADTATRERILLEASRLFRHHGYAATTLREVADAAGIKAGSIYYHFESKEQIVLELLMPSVKDQYEREVAIRAAAASATEALTAFIRTSVAVTAEHPNHSVIMRNEARTFRDVEALKPVADLRSKTLELWVDVVKQGMKQGEFRRDIDTDVVVRAIFDGVLGASRWFTGERRPKPDKIAASLVELYVRGLAA